MPFIPRPSGFSFKFPKGEAEAVLAEYNLAHCEIIAEVYQGRKILRSEAAFGTARKLFLESAGVRLVLKQLPWYCCDERAVEAMLHVVTVLHADGWPVPQILPNRRGLLFQRRSGGDGVAFYVIQDLLDGQAWMGGCGEVRAMAGLLSRFHARCETLAEADPKCQGLPSDDLFANLRIALSTLAKDVGDAKKAREIAEACTVLQERVERLCGQAAGLGYGKSKSIVHGDFNHTNVLFDGQDRIVALFDFDNLAFDHAAVDVACAILSIAAFSIDVTTQRYTVGPSRMDIDLVRSFLDEYVTAAPHAREVLRVLEPVGAAFGIFLIALGALQRSWNIVPHRNWCDFIDDVQDCFRIAAVG
jgi:Ser/Thr protein kinase RdoA (MazF antagonist)